MFWLPLSRTIGIAGPVQCPAQEGFWDQVFGSTCDWKVSMLGWMYTLFFVFLGCSAAV